MELHIDFETKSLIDIQEQGHYRYAQDPSTEIMCLSLDYNIEGRNYKQCFVAPWIIDMMVEPYRFSCLSAEVISWFNARIAAGDVFKAFNAGFERQIWRAQMVAKYGAIDIPIKQWRCVSAKAMYLGLPNSLSGVAEYIAPDCAKDAEGQKVMRLLCKPNKSGVFIRPTDFYMHKLVAYCNQDTTVEKTIDIRLPDLIPEEQQRWEMDQDINDRGMRLDVRTINEAIQIINIEKTKKEALLSEVTNGELTSATKLKDVKAFLAKVGKPVVSLNKNVVAQMVEEATGDVLTVLKLRQELGQSSLAKYEAMQRCVCADERLHGALMYAAAHTARWGGRLVQPQNLPQGKIKGTEKIEISADNLEYLSLFGNPLDVLSSATRSMFLADIGEKLIISDYSAIEARILGWYTGCEYLTEAFAKFDAGDKNSSPYIKMARIIYRNNELIKANFKEYNIGKRAVLGCGFGMGANRFYEKAIEEGIDITESLAQDAVSAYRVTNKEVCRFWKRIEQEAVMCTGHFFKDQKYPDFTFCRLPSGRCLAYYKMDVEAGKLFYWAKDPKRPSTRLIKTYIWGGSLTENIIQATARDLLACAMASILQAGYKVVLTVHDEIVVSTNSAEAHLQKIEGLMTTTPAWAKGLPLAVESEISYKYKK